MLRKRKLCRIGIHMFRDTVVQNSSNASLEVSTEQEAVDWVPVLVLFGSCAKNSEFPPHCNVLFPQVI